MNATELSTLAVAGVTVLGCVGSILLLAYRIGRLTGSTEARITHGESDRVRIWEHMGAILSKLERHIETPHGRH